MSAFKSAIRLSLVVAALLVSSGARALPNLSLSTASVNFGDVPLTATAGPTAVTITNVSGGSFGPLNMAGGAPGGPFSGTQSCQGVTLPAGGSCQIFYTFAPTALGPASSSSDFTINGESFSVALTGNGVAGLTVAPLTIDFGPVPVGTTSPVMAATVTNVSTFSIGPLSMAGGAPPAPFSGFQNCQGITLAPGATCQISYTFSPTASGPASGSSDFTLNTVPFSVSLLGTGVALSAPTIDKSFSPTTIAEGAFSTLTFTLTNPAANATALTGVGFTDVLPAGLVVGNGATPNCGGTLTTTGPNSIVLSGATITAGGTCQITALVRGISVGTFSNTTGNVTSGNGGTGNTATATITVSPPSVIPTLSGWALALLAALLVVATALHGRRRKG